MKRNTLRSTLTALVVGGTLTLACGGESPGDGAEGRGATGGRERPQLPPASVAIDAVRTGSIATHYAATATLDAVKRADVLARVSGIVEVQLVDEGDAVTAGQVLLRIDDTEYQFRLAEAQAEEARQRSRYERAKEMWEGSFTSREEFETALHEHATAEARRDLAALELSWTQVASPFAGRLTQRHVDPGQTVNPGDPLYTVVDMRKLLARVHVPAREFRRIRTDQPVTLTVNSDGTELQGLISLVSPVIDPQNGTIKVTVAISTLPDGVRPGDFAEIRIVTDRHENVPLVPREAVVNDEGQEVVYVAGADSTAERRQVQIGFRDDLNAEIVSGVEPGDSIVVQGQRSLRPGQRINVLPRLRFDGSDEVTARPDTTDAARGSAKSGRGRRGGGG